MARDAFEDVISGRAVGPGNPARIGCEHEGSSSFSPS